VLHPSGSPNQNSKTGLNCLHKLYTIKSVSDAPLESGKSGYIHVFSIIVAEIVPNEVRKLEFSRQIGYSIRKET
jgi:hypothetical protein